MKRIIAIMLTVIIALPLVSFANKNNEVYAKSGTVVLDNYIFAGKRIYYYWEQPFSYYPWMTDGAVRIHAERISTQFSYEIDLKKTNYVEFKTYGKEPGQERYVSCTITFTNITPTSAHYEIYDTTFNGCGVGKDWIAINFPPSSVPSSV